MKKNNPLIQVTGHIQGNDFSNKTWWTVSDFRKMHPETTVEHQGFITPDTENYYLERGYTAVVITDTGERFNRRYEINLTRLVPAITKFTYEWQARKYAEQISR